ncbi:MAG: hypothetical protein JSW25_03385, partial [Thermoplasmata archaeon]
FTVTVECEPSRCNSVYDAIKGIKPSKQNVVTYLACIFREGDRSILLSVLSRSPDTLASMIKEHIDSIEGVRGTEVTRIVKTKKLVTTEMWKRTIRHRTLFEFLQSVDYDEKYLNDVIAGA